MLSSNTTSHSISTESIVKIMDNIIDMAQNKNFTNKNLSVPENEKGQASIIIGKYKKIYAALEAQNAKHEESKIAKEYQIKMRDLILNFGQASQDSIKKMVDDAFKKNLDCRREVNVALFNASVSLKRLNRIEEFVKKPHHILLEDKIKEEINLKNAYDSFFKEEDYSKLESIMNTAKQGNLKKGLKKVIQMHTCVVNLDKQLNYQNHYSKEAISKFTQWERKLVVPVLSLKQMMWSNKSYEQHFQCIGSALSSLAKGEIVDLSETKILMKDHDIGPSLTILSKEMELSIQKSKQIYYQVTEIINTYKCQNDPNLASSVVDKQKMSSKVMDVILNMRLKQLEKLTKTLFEFANQAKDAVLQSSQNTRITESSLKETDFKQIIAFIRKMTHKKESNLNSSRSYPSSIIIKDVNQNLSVNEDTNEEVSLLRQAYIDICKLIIPEISEGSENINQICSQYRKRNYEIVTKINQLHQSEIQEAQLSTAKEELDKQIQLKQKAVKQIKDSLDRLSQQKQDLMNMNEQREVEFKDILSQKERQLHEINMREKNQLDQINQLRQKLLILQSQQTSERKDDIRLREVFQELSQAQKTIIQRDNCIRQQDEEINNLKGEVSQLALQIQNKDQNITQLEQNLASIQQQMADYLIKAESSTAQLIQNHKKQKTQLSQSHKLFIENLQGQHQKQKSQLFVNMNASSRDIGALLQKHEEEKKEIVRLHKEQINKINQSLRLLGRQKAQVQQQVINIKAQMKQSKQQWEVEKTRMSNLSQSEIQRQKLLAEAKYQEYLKVIKEKEDSIQTISQSLAGRDTQLCKLSQTLSTVEKQLEKKVEELSDAETKLNKMKNQKKQADSQVTSLKKRIRQLQDSAKTNKQTEGEERGKLEAQCQDYLRQLSTQQANIKQSEIFISKIKKDHEKEIILIKSNHQTQLEQVNAQIKQMGDSIQKKDLTLNSANSIVREKEKKVKELEESIKDKQKKIKEHQMAVTESEDKHLTLLEENANLKQKLEEAEIKIQKLEKDKANIFIGQAKEKQNEVKQLNQLLARERTSFKALQSKLEEERKLSKSWQQKLAAAEAELKKKPSVSSQLLIRNKQLKQLDERIQKRKQDVVFIESAEARSEKYNQLARQYSLCPLFIAFINSLFYGEILDEEFEMKVRLVRHVEGLMKTPIKAAKMIFKYDSLNPTNFHKYIDDHRNLVCVVKLSNGNFIATFYSGVYSRGEPMISPSLIMSLSSNESYELYNATTNSTVRTFRGMTYDDFFLIFGNAEMRIRANEKTVFSNFGIGNSFFNNRGAKVNQILGAGENREVEFQGYEIYELAFEEKQE